MSRDLGDLGRTVRLRPARRRRLVPLVVLLVAAVAVAGRAAGDRDRAPGELGTGPAPAAAAEAPSVEGDAETEGWSVEQPEVAAAEDAPVEPAVALPVLGRAGGLLLHVPAEQPLVVSYHEASFPEALPIEPLGDLTGNENSTRPIRHASHPDGIGFHVQVSRGRANASTSAVDVVLPPGAEVRAPVAGTVAEVRPYQLYGRHDDVRLELHPDDTDLAVVLIHLEGVVVGDGDRVEVGDVLAGAAREFTFGAVVDRQTEPERHGHVHMEVKRPDAVAPIQDAAEVAE